MRTVTSADGTTIAYDRTGPGEPVVLVAGAFSYRRYPGQVKLTALIAAGQRGAAVRYFMADGMGAPSFVPGLLWLMPRTWKKLTAVAPTPPCDAA